MINITKPYHDVHNNSREALPQTPRIDRKLGIWSFLKRVRRNMTDREIMRCMGFTEPNQVRPRITEMIHEKPPRLEQKGSTIENGRKVRLVGLPCSIGEQRRIF